MTDNYSGRSGTDPQSLRIKEEQKTWPNPNAANSWEDEKALEAAHDAKKLLDAVLDRKTPEERRKPKAHIRQAEGQGETPFIGFESGGLWRSLGDTTQQTTTVFEREGFTRSQFSRLMRDSVITKATLEAEKHDTVVLNPASTSIYYRNGVYDWNEQRFRQLTVEDHRTVRGEGRFHEEATDEDKDCFEVLNHVRQMAGDNADKERLIHAVNALNIIGVQTLGSNFKTSIFLWVCPEGNGGRSSLFRVIKRASGQNVVQFDNAEQLTDANKLLQLEGKNGIYIDERQVATSAKAHWVSILKQIVGGDGELTTKRLYSDIGTTRGQWTFNQATNSTEFLHGCDKALFDRFVAIKTVPFEDDVIAAFVADETREKTLHSEKTASSYVKWLRANFGTLREVAAEVTRLRKHFMDDIAQVADQTTPWDEFFGRFVKEETGADGLSFDFLFHSFKAWAAVHHPNSKVLQQSKQFSQALNTRFGGRYGKQTSGTFRGKRAVVGVSFKSNDFADATSSFSAGCGV